MVQGSAERLAPVVQAMEPPASLPGWRLRVLDGNHLPASDKRLAPLRGCRGAALPGQALVVYDPDTTLVTDLVACEDAHAQERSGMPPLLACAQAGELWIADRNFCTRTIMQGLHDAEASITRARTWHAPAAAQSRQAEGVPAHRDGPTLRADDQHRGGPDTLAAHRAAPGHAHRVPGETTIWLWSNLPREVSASKIAELLYRKRWCIEGMFQRLDPGGR